MEESSLNETPVKKRKPNPECLATNPGPGEPNSSETNDCGDEHVNNTKSNLDKDADIFSDKVEEASGSSSPSSSSPSESDWHPAPGGCYQWMHEQMLSGTDPREIIQKIVPSAVNIPDEVDTWTLWKLVIQLVSEPPKRRKLPNINTFSDAVNLIKSSKKIIVLTGAGVSVSCGIPDFRSRDGVYARLAVDFPDLPSPESMFDISYFRQDPRPFFKFAKEIYPGQFKPSKIHRFIATLDKTGRLLRNYTQNIDTLEQVAGIKNVIQCHGSFATATCQICKYKTDSETIREDIFNQVIPRCPQCQGEERGILKPDIVFFGENLPDHFHRQMVKDKEEVDLLIVIGSALKVRPVALIPSSIPPEVPQILINREALNHMTFDVDLLGDGDTIVSQICRHMGADFASLLDDSEELKEVTTLPESSNSPNSSPQLPANKTTQDVHDNQHISSSQSHDNYKSNTRLTETTTEPHKTHDNLSHDQPDDTTSHVSNHESGNHHDCKSRLEASRGVDETNMNGDVSTEDITNTKTKHDHSVIAVVNGMASSDSGQGESEGQRHPNEHKANKENCNRSQAPDAEISSTGVAPNGDNPEKMSIRGFWQSRWKQSISKRLPAGCYHYDGKHRYIFPGAEVPPEEESDSSSDEEDDDVEEGSSSDDEITGISPLRRHPLPPRYRRRAEIVSHSHGTNSQEKDNQDVEIPVASTSNDSSPAST